MLNEKITRRAVLHFMATGTLLMGMNTMGLASDRYENGLSFAVTTPVHVESIALRVRDLERMTDFYHRMIGLDIISKSATDSVLGKDGVPLLDLLLHADAQPDDGVSAGLFHTAFLMPSRKALGEWLLFAYRSGVQFTGFADHLVSEAAYLDDPEGNGIEVYADRSPLSWQWDKDHIVMATEELDIPGLVGDGSQNVPPHYSAPSGLRIGHVHLRVGDVDRAEDFYIGAAGLDQTARLKNSATFLSNGHYHHHVGANVWQSRGAGQRDDKMAGLEYVTFATALPLMDGLRQRLRDKGFDFHEQGDQIEALDPWGSKIRFKPA